MIYLLFCISINISDEKPSTTSGLLTVIAASSHQILQFEIVCLTVVRILRTTFLEVLDLLLLYLILEVVDFSDVFAHAQVEQQICTNNRIWYKLGQKGYFMSIQCIYNQY